MIIGGNKIIVTCSYSSLQGHLPTLTTVGVITTTRDIVDCSCRKSASWREFQVSATVTWSSSVSGIGPFHSKQYQSALIIITIILLVEIIHVREITLVCTSVTYSGEGFPDVFSFAVYLFHLFVLGQLSCLEWSFLPEFPTCLKPLKWFCFYSECNCFDSGCVRVSTTVKSYSSPILHSIWSA